jgi:hypothetical protein
VSSQHDVDERDRDLRVEMGVEGEMVGVALLAYSDYVPLVSEGE